MRMSELESESELERSMKGRPWMRWSINTGTGWGCSSRGEVGSVPQAAAVDEVRRRGGGCSCVHEYLVSMSRSLAVGVGTLLGPGVAFRGPGSSLFCRSSSDDEAT